jgi:hypothetical protein
MENNPFDNSFAWLINEYYIGDEEQIEKQQKEENNESN